MQTDASDIGLGAILEEEVMLLLMLAVLYQRPKNITVLSRRNILGLSVGEAILTLSTGQLLHTCDLSQTLAMVIRTKDVRIAVPVGSRS